MVLSQKYQLIDLAVKRNTTWKAWNNCVRVSIFILCFLMQLFPSGWQDYLLAGAINILFFEMAYNVIAVKMPIFFVGKSSKFDTLGKKKWWYMFGFLIIAIFIKIKL